MKKSAKLLGLVLALLMVMSCFTGLTVFSASAAEDTKIYFEFPSADVADWGESGQTVYCHIYNVYGDDTLYTPLWMSSKEKCAYDEEKGLYYFDTAALCDAAYDEEGNPTAGAEHGGLHEHCDYGISFYTSSGNQTCDVTLSKECVGGTVVCTGESVYAPQDSSKSVIGAAWKESELAAEFGPMITITPTGEVTNLENGKFGKYQPREAMAANYIHNYAVINADTPNALTTDIVLDVCAKIEAEPIDVYNSYASAFEAELADLEAYPMTASLATVAKLLNVDPDSASIYGDADGNGLINVSDVTEIQKMTVGIVKITPESLKICDVNGDGSVSIQDVTLIQKYIAKLGYNTYLVGQKF